MKSHPGTLNAFSLDDNDDLLDSTVMKSSVLAGNEGAGTSTLPKLSKKMLRDKLKREKQRNTELLSQVKTLQRQLDERLEIVESDDNPDEPAVFREVAGPIRSKKKVNNLAHT